MLSTFPEDGAQMLKDLEKALREVGLRTNPEKTSFLTTLPSRAKVLPGVCLNNEGLPIVGRLFQLQDNSASEVERRIKMAWSKFFSLKEILRQRTPLRHRLKIVNACIYQSLLWGSQSWTVTRRRCQRLRGFEKQLMRTLVPCPKALQDLPKDELFTKWDDHIKTSLEEAQHTSLDRQWLGRWHGWAGHVARLPHHRWALKTQQHRNIGWWRAQQRLQTGFRHHGRKAHLARWENALDRYHPLKHNWEEEARNREDWVKGRQDFILNVLGWEKHTEELHCPHLNPAQALVLDTTVTRWTPPQTKT